MKTFRRGLGILLAVTLAGAGLIACGPIDDNNGADAGADTGFTDGGADTGFMDTGMDGGTDGGMGCEDNEDCPGEDNICNPQGMCEMISTGPTIQFAQIKDVTLDVDPDAEAEACTASGNAKDNPGSDIFAVELVDSEGNHKGWGKWVTNANAGGNNTHTNFEAILNGDEPSLTQMGDNQCIDDFGTDTIVSLGCQNGVMVVGFHNDNDEYVEIKKDDQILVHEYGAQCGGSAVDKLNVQLCTAQADSDFFGSSPDMDGDYPSCKNMPLGQGGGFVTAPVTSLPETSNNSGM